MKDDLAQRLLPLDGGINFRDMGGYAASDGRRVKWGHLFRSGTMARLSGQDRKALAERGIRTVIDFRSASEQEAEPNAWAQEETGGYWSRPHDEVFGNMHEMAANGIATVREAEAIMEAGYRHLPLQQAEAYGEMLRRLAAGAVPAVIHCTAGKDRTGGGAALILAVLGVSREAIIADFVLTERAVDLEKALLHRKPDPRYAHYAKLGPDIRRAFSGARSGYISAFLDALDARFGSVENYCADLGLGRSDLGSLRANLLE